VMSNWKGVNTARTLVIPANPRTADQQTQRGYMSNAVAGWHATPFTAADIAALNLAATKSAKPLSGFNYFCRDYISALQAGETVVQPYDVSITDIRESSATGACLAASDHDAVLYLGTSPGSMLTQFEGAWTAGTTSYEFTITDLSQLTEYWCYIKMSAANYAGRTGIYRFKTTAAA